MKACVRMLHMLLTSKQTDVKLAITQLIGQSKPIESDGRGKSKDGSKEKEVKSRELAVALDDSEINEAKKYVGKGRTEDPQISEPDEESDYENEGVHFCLHSYFPN